MEKNISEYRTVQFYTRHVVYKKLTTISFLVQTSASIFTFSVNLTELRIILKKLKLRYKNWSTNICKTALEKKLRPA